MKILAVDDDESICALLEEAVAAKTEHTLVTAPSGPEAIRIIAKAKVPFDCFLLDIQMPVLDGIALAAKIRKTKGYARTPIIMLTAMSQKKYVDAAFAAGASDFVTKPFDFLELFSRISMAQHMVLEQQRTHDAAAEMVALKRELRETVTQSLDEPIELTGVTQVVGYVSFEDHLLNMPRRAVRSSCAFAVKVDTIQSAFTTLSPHAFRRMLTDISSELMSVVANNAAIATYRGSGDYLCILPRNRRLQTEQIEADLNDRLRYLPSTQIDGLVSRVTVGQPQKLATLTRAGALLALQRALANAQSRAQHRNVQAPCLRKPLRQTGKSGFQNEMERRAYEHLLHDALREDIASRQTATAFG
ncbi:response regulator [Shimia sp. MMG029]|uniref:response regulator n=1 Tax=Shimia sp. MMG029 TaxID=3021978 RepID=UPI0022FF13EF|nr:response regulator [Shimia sp. MMG029]MDA5556372.1 response regulator [Shimia sp. MMG029]